MTTIFQTHQSNDGTIQSARLHIPGCGNNKVRDGSSIAIEIEGGKITLLVFGDINSPVPTHEIDMTGALESAIRLKLRRICDPWRMSFCG